MKKVIYIMLCLFLIFSFSSCKKSESNKNGTDSGAYKPSLMYDNVVYSLSSEKSENFIVDKDSLEYVGTIKDTISGTTLPTQNFQASGNSELLDCDIYSSKDYPDRLFVFCEGNHYYVYDKE